MASAQNKKSCQTCFPNGAWPFLVHRLFDGEQCNTILQLLLYLIHIHTYIHTTQLKEFINIKEFQRLHCSVKQRLKKHSKKHQKSHINYWIEGEIWRHMPHLVFRLFCNIQNWSLSGPHPGSRHIWRPCFVLKAITKIPKSINK